MTTSVVPFANVCSTWTAWYDCQRRTLSARRHMWFSGS